MQVKKGGTLNNSLMATGNVGPHLILQNYHGTGYPPVPPVIPKSPQNANNYAPLSPIYGTSAKQQKQQVSSAMEKHYGNKIIQAADISLVASKQHSSKVTSGQKKRNSRAKASR